jgi:NDP-sugar pyrophosphorylase family protein
MDLTLVVLAAGLSTRYGGVKQLEAVGPSGETLLDYGIYDAVRAGFSRVVLVTRRELESGLRQHVVRVFGDALALSFAYQELDAVPEGFSVPEARRKPWGTGHAVLAAEPHVDGPFVAMNADDFYGAPAYVRLAEHLRRPAGSRELEFAAAGYTLRDTLSPFGGVSRAVCELDDAGYLRRVREIKNITEEGGVLAGVTVRGERVVLTGDEIISMNLWAATPAAFPLLRRQFVMFLAEHGADPEAEFLLSTAVNDQIEAGRVRVRVIPTPGPWLGVTYREDRVHVERVLRRLIAEGHYPESLSIAPPGEPAAKSPESD